MNTIHFLPADDASQFGSGSTTDPIRIMPAPGDFDRWMQIVAARPAIGRVVLRPGVYDTLGAWYYGPPHYSMIPRPMTLEGAVGDERPRIRLSPYAVFASEGTPRPDTQVMQLGRMGGDLPGIQIRRLVVDGNEAALTEDQLVTAGVHLWGSGAVIEDVEVLNLRGSRELLHEAFGVLVKGWADPAHAGPSGGTLIRRVTVNNDGGRSNYFSGIYAGYTDVGKGVEMTLVEECAAYGIGSSPSRLAFSFGSYVDFSVCFAENFSYGPYTDTKAAEDVRFMNCSWRDLAHCAVRLAADGAVRRAIHLDRCTFAFAPQENVECIGIEIIDLPQVISDVSDVSIRNCAFVMPQGTARPFVAYSMNAERVRNCRLIDCNFPDGAVANVVGKSPRLASGLAPESAVRLVSCLSESGARIRDLRPMRAVA